MGGAAQDRGRGMGEKNETFIIIINLISNYNFYIII
jgi:hypothetical protein